MTDYRPKTIVPALRATAVLAIHATALIRAASLPQLESVGRPESRVAHGAATFGRQEPKLHRSSRYFQRARVVQDLSAVTAACLVIRRETYLRIGGLDESLAVAFNDVDFCLRLRETGAALDLRCGNDLAPADPPAARSLSFPALGRRDNARPERVARTLVGFHRVDAARGGSDC